MVVFYNAAFHSIKQYLESKRIRRDRNLRISGPIRQISTSGLVPVDMPTKPHPAARVSPQRRNYIQSSPVHQQSPAPRPLGTPTASTPPNSTPPPYYKRLRLQIDTGRTKDISSFDSGPHDADVEEEEGVIPIPTPLQKESRVTRLTAGVRSPASPRTPASVSPSLSVSMTAPKSPVPVLTPQGYSRERIGLFPAPSAASMTKPTPGPAKPDTRAPPPLTLPTKPNHTSNTPSVTNGKSPNNKTPNTPTNNATTAAENKGLIFQMQRRYKIKR